MASKEINESRKISESDAKTQSNLKLREFCYNYNINPDLITLKLCLFLLYGASASLLPYLTIHMQSIGLTIQEIAMIYLALPFTTFLAPPITGLLIDKFGKYKPIVITSLILNAIIHHALLMIPHQELPGVMPAAYVIRHNVTEVVEVWWSPCPSRECPEDEELDMVLDRCIDYCLLSEEANNPEVQANPITANNKKIKNDDAKTNLKSIPDIGEQDDLIFHLGHRSQPTFLVIDMHPNLAEPSEQFGIEIVQNENDTITEFTDRFTKEYLHSNGINVTALEELDLRCGGVVLATNLTYKNRLEELAANCILQKCSFRNGGPEICPPDYKESDDVTFWIYFVLRFLGQTAHSASVTVIDPIALILIQKYNGDFGKERLFSSIGMALFAPITGFFIDLYSKSVGHTDYTPAFITYDILLMISAFTVYFMPLEEKLPADNVFRDLMNILKMPHVIIFIVFLLFLGNFWGFIESFLFLYLKELGAPNYMLGITVTVGTLSSIPFLYGADQIIKKIGHVNVIVIAFFSHAARLVGYSFIESPWWCFPFEALESLSVHLLWVAAATYCAILAPKSLLASLIGVLGMAHFSIGRGSGSFLGGILIENFGIRESFRNMGLAAVVSGLVYRCLHSQWLEKYENKKRVDDVGATEIETSSHISVERLSFVVKYNSIGSLSSLRCSFSEHLPVDGRSSSTVMDITRKGSVSKVSMLKSAIERNSASSSQFQFLQTNLSRNRSIYLKISNDSLDLKSSSAPKLTQRSIPQLMEHERLTKTDSIKETIEENDEIKNVNKI